MDPQVIAELERAGFDPSVFPAPRLAVRVSEDGQRILPLEGEALVRGDGEKVAYLQLKPLAELLTGTRVPPSFDCEPPAEYLRLFVTIEVSAAEYCRFQRRPEYDLEFNRSLSHL